MVEFIDGNYDNFSSDIDSICSQAALAEAEACFTDIYDNPHCVSNSVSLTFFYKKSVKKRRAPRNEEVFFGLDFEKSCA